MTDHTPTPRARAIDAWNTYGKTLDVAECRKGLLAVDADLKRAWELVAEERLAHLKLREVVQWISDQDKYFFAECSLAEEIVKRCRDVLGARP